MDQIQKYLAKGTWKLVTIPVNMPMFALLLILCVPGIGIDWSCVPGSALRGLEALYLPSLYALYPVKELTEEMSGLPKWIRIRKQYAKFNIVHTLSDIYNYSVQEECMALRGPSTEYTYVSLTHALANAQRLAREAVAVACRDHQPPKDT